MSAELRDCARIELFVATDVFVDVVVVVVVVTVAVDAMEMIDDVRDGFVVAADADGSLDNASVSPEDVDAME